MFGNKYQNVFRSRWRALMWASGVMLTAYCSVPSPDPGDQASHGAAPHAVAAHKHHNPWAIDPSER